MNNSLETKRILIFLAFVIGVSWVVALVIYSSSLMQSDPNTGMSLANYIIIFTPALANIFTRLVTKEGWGNLWLKPNFRRGWRFYLAAWLLPLAAVIMGAGAYYLLFPQAFDLSPVQKLTASSPATAAINPWLMLLSIVMQSALLAVPINSIVSIGEEFGWRAYLLQKLAARFSGADGHSNGFPAAAAIKASLLVGAAWGVWHWPLFLLSTKIDPSMPLLYPLVYVLSTCAMSVLLCWVTLRSGSVWTASVGHGAVNAFSGLVALTMAGAGNMLLGPMTGSLIGSAGFFILALVLIFNRKAFATGEEARPEAVTAAAGG